MAIQFSNFNLIYSPVGASVAAMPCMDSKTFITQFRYALEEDFKSATGLPATWAPGHPRYWGEELAEISLGARGTTPTLTPDDKFVAVGVKRTIHIYSVPTRARVQVLTGHLKDIHSLEISPTRTQDGGYVLASYSDQIVLWTLDADGRNSNPYEHIADSATLATEAAHMVVGRLVQKHGWKPDEDASQSIAEDFEVAMRKALDMHTLEGLISIKGRLASFGSPVYSRDGKMMIYLAQNSTTQHGMRDEKLLPSVNIWDVEKQETRNCLMGHTDSIMWAGASPDSHYIASISWDGTVRIWVAETGACMRILGSFGGQMWSGTFSPDSKYLAFSQGSPETVVFVYNITSGMEISRFDGFRGWARTMHWRPDGQTLAVGGRDGIVHILNPYTGQSLMRWCLSAEDPVQRAFMSVSHVRFIAGGRQLAIRLSEGTTEVYDFSTNLKQQFIRRNGNQVHTMPHSGACYSSDSSLLVVSEADNAIRFWNLM